MKLEIEFTDRWTASLKIDGKEMQINTTCGCASLDLGEGTPTDGTLGAIVACDIYDKISTLQEACAAAAEIDQGVGTWDELSEDAAEAAHEALW